MKKSLLSSAAALFLGLGLSVAAWAEPVDGEVRKVDPDAGKVTLKHGEIKNLDMPAMQMSYKVANPEWLKTLQVGDKVRFTADKVESIDYKDLGTLKGYISETGKIVPSRITGTKSFFQRQLAVAIKRARFLALLPYTDLH